MASFRSLFSLLLCSAIASGPSLVSQSVPPPASVHGRPVPASVDPMANSPFDASGAPASPFQILPAGEMSQADKDLLARFEPALQRQAKNMDMGFSQGNWTYAQLACPSFPNHLFLRFTRNGGKGDLSGFSASIPRASSGRLRLIPVLRRGYSLFSPAPANPVTVAVFNRILGEEKSSTKPNWVDVARCYAALAGADSEPPSSDQATAASISSIHPIMELTLDGRSIIRFVTAQPRPREWEMTFDRKGKLIDARYSSGKSEMLHQHPVGPPSKLRVTQVPPGGAVKSRPIPPA